MSTDFGATESSSDALVLSEPPINSDIEVVNGVMVVDKSLDSKTETLTTEPSSGGIVAQDLAVDDRVSGGKTGIGMDNDEKLLDESSIDAVVKFGGDLLESKSGSLIMETCDNIGGGDNHDIAVQDLIDEARVSRDGTEAVTENSELVQDLVDGAVSGDEMGTVMDNDRKLLDVLPAAGDGVNIGAELLESKSGTLIMESSDHAVQDLIDEARVTGDQIGIVTENSDHDGGGDIAAQDSIGEVRVSGDRIGIVTEDSELVPDLVDGGRVSGETDSSEKLMDVSSSDAVVSFVTPVANEGAKNETDLLESKSGTLISESSDHDGGGDIAVPDSVDKDRVARVIGDETGIVTEKSVLVLDKSISDAVVSSLPLNNRDIGEVNEIKIGADSLGSKTETATVNPSHDQNGAGDIAVQGSVQDSRVSEDEKGIVMENIEKVSDENEVIHEEKEGEYKTTDIVWAKVKDYPWWPGQIFDPSSSTDKAKKYSNKKGFLVGYYGDQTFAWNKVPKIKPFRKNFSKLEKQSNSKPFFHAVNCALEEVSRRVEFGLACSCLSKEVCDKIKSQVFVNAGIKKEDSKIDGGDRFSTVSTFKPKKVVQSVQELAREHFDGFSRLDVLSVRTQLLAFFRWKGYYQFQTQDILDGLDNKLEDGSELPLTEEIKVVEDEKLTSVSKKVSSKKRKPDVCDSDDSVPHKKERSLTSVTPKDKLSAKRSKKDISKKAIVDDNVFKEEKGNEKPASVGKKVSSKKKKPDVCDSDDSVPHKKERSVGSVSPKGISSAKRSKKDISRNVLKEEKGNEKPASVGKKVSSKKKKPDICDSDESAPRKKERSLTDMTKSSVKRSKKGISKQATVDDKRSSISSPKKLFRVGDSISRIAKQISESPSILKKESQESGNDEKKTGKEDGKSDKATQIEE
ncbi:hypothetical protein SSX86_000963 [Deinandra increscens subsp. villosa]|uniref:PWWP domain-containing protein n=1 Tax=Deinandra increscens subsp. villosa TaxID=3103831 RepID=A0AAP0DV76_9ASTR